MSSLLSASSQFRALNSFHLVIFFQFSPLPPDFPRTSLKQTLVEMSGTSGDIWKCPSYFALIWTEGHWSFLKRVQLREGWLLLTSIRKPIALYFEAASENFSCRLTYHHHHYHSSFLPLSLSSMPQYHFIHVIHSFFFISLEMGFSKTQVDLRVGNSPKYNLFMLELSIAEREDTRVCLTNWCSDPLLSLEIDILINKCPQWHQKWSYLMHSNKAVCVCFHLFRIWHLALVGNTWLKTADSTGVGYFCWSLICTLSLYSGLKHCKQLLCGTLMGNLHFREIAIVIGLLSCDALDGFLNCALDLSEKLLAGIV